MGFGIYTAWNTVIRRSQRHLLKRKDFSAIWKLDLFR